MAKKYDVIIIGAGPGGLTAALYASRANLSVLILDRGIYGGQMNNTAEIENYPGYTTIMGPELSEKMYASATHFGAEYAYGTVKDVTVLGDMKHVVTDEGNYEAPAVVIATGADHRHVGVPGEDDYSGRGVSYCAVCDGAFFRNKPVTVIGGGDSAVEEGLYLAQLASHVTIIHRRDQLRAQQILQKRAFNNDKLSFIWNAQLTSINGDDRKVGSVTYRDKISGTSHDLVTAGVFVYVGIEPLTAPFKNLGILDDKGWIVTDDVMATQVPGVFAVGDARQKKLRQIVTAVGEGGLAGQGVFDYLQSLQDK